MPTLEELSRISAEVTRAREAAIRSEIIATVRASKIKAGKR